MIIFNYTLNYIDVALCAILLLFIIIGYCRGLLINVVNFIRWATGLFLCFFISENATPFVYNTYVKPKALEAISKNIVTSTNLDEIIKNLKAFGESLPKAVASSVDFGSLTVSGDDLANEILERYFEGVLTLLVHATIFLAVFVVFFLITGIIIFAVRRHSKKKEEKRGRKSALKVTDRVLGGLLGVLKGALVVFAVCSVLMFVLGLFDEPSKVNPFLKEIESSKLLKLLDEINPFNAITGGLL